MRVAVGPDAIAFYDSSLPTNVYEAFKDSNFQVEVYSPSAQQARKIVADHKIVAAGGASAAASLAGATGRRDGGHGR